MNAYLLYRHRDFDPVTRIPSEEDVARDLDLATIFDAMAGEDSYVRDVVRRVMLTGTNDRETILYRQGILADCVAHTAVIQEIYDVTVAALDAERRDYFGGLARSASSVLYSSTSILQMFADTLQRLRQIADEHVEDFESEGIRRLLQTLQNELSDDYLELVRQQLKRLRFPDGIFMSARLGEGNKGTDYVLRTTKPSDGGWLRHMFAPMDPLSFQVADRDETGARALEALRTRGTILVATAAGQSAAHISSFFKMLRYELAFYLGGARLHGQLIHRNVAITYPHPIAEGERVLRAAGLQNVALALRQDQQVVPNDLDADGKGLLIVTGANQGGKSTFIRSLGCAQLMMQCGLFVCATTFSSDVVERVFTHFKREEDLTMSSGKLDEELARMSAIADHLVANALVLFNESFSATNEFEGSEIAEQIVSALLDRKIKVILVTHQYEFARRFLARHLPGAIFLRAQRLNDGTRTFRIEEGMPEETSHGEDLYREIFLNAGARDAATARDITPAEPERGLHVPGG